MNEFKDVFENMHTAPYEIITVNRKKENGFNNMIVAILVSVSLYYTPNLASWVIEIFWFLISVYGLWKFYSRA